MRHHIFRTVYSTTLPPLFDNETVRFHAHSLFHSFSLKSNGRVLLNAAFILTTV